MMRFLPCSAAAGALVLLLSSGGLRAADYHCLPQGAGKKDGSSWANAGDQGALAGWVSEKLQPGDRLLVGSGQYANVTLKVTRGGTEGKPITLLGVDRGAGLPVFTSSWTVEKPDKGASWMDLGPGVSHVTVQHLRLKNYCFGVRAPVAKEAPRQHLVFDDVDMEQFRHGFYLSHCQDLRVENCDLKHYSKHAFRWDQGCQKVVVRACVADCTEGNVEWEAKTELFPFGFTVNDGGDPNTNFQFEDCLAQNNRKSNQTIKYTNGDGFVVEGNSADFSFLRCRSFHNQDGGFDLKVTGVKLKDCVASGQRRDFRIWNEGSLVNCFGGWSQAGLWCKKGGVTAERCTFHEQRQVSAEADAPSAAPVVLQNCVLSSLAVVPKVASPKPPVELKNCVQVDAKTNAATVFAQNDPAWNGVGLAMDYKGKADVGYHAPKPVPVSATR